MNEVVEETKKDLVPSSYREKYAETGGTCGDFIATALQDVTKDGPMSLVAVMKENGIDEGKYAHFNVGMQRMNLSNILRSRFLRGEPIYVLGKEYDVKQMLDDAGFTTEGVSSVADKFIEKIGLQLKDHTRAQLTKLFFGPKKKTAEEREAEKAERAAAKAAEKAAKAEKREAEKAERAAAKAKEKADKDAAKAAAKAE